MTTKTTERGEPVVDQPTGSSRRIDFDVVRERARGWGPPPQPIPARAAATPSLTPREVEAEIREGALRRFALNGASLVQITRELLAAPSVPSRLAERIVHDLAKTAIGSGDTGLDRRVVAAVVPHAAVRGATAEEAGAIARLVLLDAERALARTAA